MEAAAFCADRVSEVEIKPKLASVRQPTDNAALRQEIADLSRQVAALSAGQDRLHARFKKLNLNPRDRGPSPKEGGAPSTAAGLAADTPPVATLPVHAGTIAASALGRKTVLRPAPTASRETDATDIIGGMSAL